MGEGIVMIFNGGGGGWSRVVCGICTDYRPKFIVFTWERCGEKKKKRGGGNATWNFLILSSTRTTIGYRQTEQLGDNAARGNVM